MSEPTRETTHGHLDLDDLDQTEQVAPVEPSEQTASGETASIGESPTRVVSNSETWVQPVDDAVPYDRSAATTTWIALSLGLVGIGFVAMVFASSKIAEFSNVAEQLPYVVSGGLSGLVVVIIGVVILDVTVRRRDSQERCSQLATLTGRLAELRDRLEPEPIADEEDEAAPQR